MIPIHLSVQVSTAGNIVTQTAGSQWYNGIIKNFATAIGEFFNGSFFGALSDLFNALYSYMPAPILLLLSFYVLIMSIRVAMRLTETVLSAIP